MWPTYPKEGSEPLTLHRRAWVKPTLPGDPRDPRVGGAILINICDHLHGMDDEWGASIRGRALLRHYWRIAFSSSFRAKNWLKAVTGKVDYQRLKRMLYGFRLGSLFTPRITVSSGTRQGLAEMHSLSARGVRLLHVYSEGDEGLDYLHVLLSNEQIRELWKSNTIDMELIQGANHTFTLLWSQEHLLRVVCRWARATWNP
jgi:hypothetical protein